jgi:excisionase family DNA binding protein
VSPSLLTVAEAAATLRCKRTKVFELLANGTLVRGAKYGRQTVILAESVFAALEKAYDPPAPRRRQSRRAVSESLDAMLAKARATAG